MIIQDVSPFLTVSQGPGAKGITSITPMSLCASTTSSPSVDQLSTALSSPSFRYYIVTSTLSTIAEDTASYTAVANGHSSTKSPVPWCEHLYRSAVSPDGRLAAFLTDQGRLKLASIVSSNGDPTLRMRDIPNRKFQTKKEPEVQNAGKIGIRVDPIGYIVTLVDRHGTVNHVRLVEAQNTQSNLKGVINIPAKSTSRKFFPSAIAPNVSELSDSNLPIRELAAPDRFPYYQ